MQKTGINWTKILSENNLETPGYHEAVLEARQLQAQKVQKKMEELAVKRNDRKKKKLSRGEKR